MTDQRIQSVLESLLFVWGEPLSARAAAELFDLSESETARLLRELADDYRARGSGLRIREMDGSFQLCTAMENDDYIRKFCTPVKEKRLSQAALEVLAVVAYNQPVTKAFVEQVRGVDCTGVIGSLTVKNLIEEKGRLELPGRPLLYGTTENFLKCFQLSSLDDLPPLPKGEDKFEEDGNGDKTEERTHDGAEE